MTTADPLFAPAALAWQPASPRLVRLRRVTLAIWLGAVVIVLAILGLVVTPWLLVPAGALALLFIWIWLLIPRQVRAIGYAEREDDLLIRRGILFRTLVVVPYGRMQFVDVSVGPLERAFKVASLKLHTASAGTDADLDGLPPEEAARLRDRLASRGESRMAGL